MKKGHRFGKYIITISDIGKSDGVCYFKESYETRYPAGKLKRLYGMFNGYRISIYDCDRRVEVYDGKFDLDPCVTGWKEHYLTLGGNAG